MGRDLREVLTADGPCSTGRDAGLGSVSGRAPGEEVATRLGQ